MTFNPDNTSVFSLIQCALRMNDHYFCIAMHHRQHQLECPLTHTRRERERTSETTLQHARLLQPRLHMSMPNAQHKTDITHWW